MITDDDVKKLKKAFKGTFATKADLKAMEARQDKKFATKDDLKALAKQKDLLSVKKDLADVKNKLTELSNYVIPALGNIFRWTDDIHRAVLGKPMKSPHGN